MREKILFVFPLFLACGTVSAQSPTPIIVQAASATAATSTSSKSAATTIDVQSIPDALKLLEQIKAANDEVLAKQKAAFAVFCHLRFQRDGCGVGELTVGRVFLGADQRHGVVRGGGEVNGDVGGIARSGLDGSCRQRRRTYKA